MGVRPLAVLACVLVAAANQLAAAAVLGPTLAPPPPPTLPPPAPEPESAPSSPHDVLPLAVPARSEVSEAPTEQDAAPPGPTASPAAHRPAATDVTRTAALVTLTFERDSLTMCRRPGGPDGPGTATVRFRGEEAPEIVVAAPYAGTSVGACIVRRLARGAGLVPPNTLVLEVPFDL